MTASPDAFQFKPATKFPPLGPGEVHIWSVALDHEPPEGESLLSPDEVLRAARLIHGIDRRRYRAAHTALRKILAGYLGQDAAAIRFERGPHGKPFVPDALFRFNLSHSQELMLLAVASGRELGVDVEHITPNVPTEMLAEHYFAAEDQWALRTAPAAERLERFFEIWTRTEAILKARGVGLASDLGDSDSATHVLHSFRPASGYIAALAVEGNASQFSCWQWLS